MKNKHINYILPAITLIVITILINCNTALAYECSSYGISVPDDYTIDSESIDNYTSLYGDDVTIGIKVESNMSMDDVSTYTESEINNLVSATISKLDSKAGGNATSTGHSIMSFSASGYPALMITYEGKDSETTFYMEEYIITMSEHKYTIIFSANDASMIKTEEVDNIKAGFVAYDQPIIHKQPADTSTVFNIFVALCVLLVIACTIVIILIVRKKS